MQPTYPDCLMIVILADYGLGWFNHVINNLSLYVWCFVCLLEGGLRREKPCGCLVFPFRLRAHMVRGNWMSSIL
jgi:hypothetical protein